MNEPKPNLMNTDADNIVLDREDSAKLRRVAEDEGVPVEALIRRMIDGVERRGGVSFEEAAETTLKKNRELYRRLA